MRLSDLIAHYTRDAHPSQKDREVLNKVDADKGKTPVAALTIAWVDAWVTEMKRVEKLAPSTIRAKVGAVGRAVAWVRRKDLVAMSENPFHDLPDGYATYTGLDAKLAGEGREDVERDRRLEGDEEKHIRAVIESGVLPRKLRPRPIPHPADLMWDFTLAIETAMRLRERYTLTVDQVSIAKRTIFLERTKNGDSRQVPLSSVAVAVMQEQIAGKAPDEKVFPWWSGDASEKGLKATSNFLSKLYADIFDAAGCPDLREHDLRHEATSRFFEKTRLPGEAIAKITGHRDPRMLMRYLKLRGSDLAAQLW
jgi:integrase